MKLKRWCEALLIITTFIAVLVASSECDNNWLFLFKTIISITIICINASILYKYGRL